MEINGKSCDNKRIKEKLFNPSKLDSSSPIYKKRNFDVTDYAYREAVDRLKFLLADNSSASQVISSNPYGKPKPTSTTIEEINDGRPDLADISKYLPSSGGLARHNSLRRLNYTSPLKEYGLKSAVSMQSLHPTSSQSVANNQQQLIDRQQPPQELLNFIEKQESYIEQLERESQFCREELSGLLNKVKEVVNENEQLTDQAKYGGSSKSKLFQLTDSSESDENGMLEKYKLPSKHQKLSGPNIVFESRISELEAQLAQSNIDLQRIAEENDANKRKLAFGGGQHNNTSSSYLNNGNDSTSSDVYKKQIENLQRDKHNLEDSVKKLQDQITTLKESDSHNYTKTQRSRDLVETAVFEKKQTDIEVRRLKEELERQHERMRELQHEMSRRLTEERTNAERRYNYHVEQLGGDLNSQWEYATKLQLELERQRRFESDFKRDLSQKNSQIEELKTDLKNKSVTYASDLAQCRAEKESMEQEITSLRLQLDRAERQSKVELTRLQAEIASLRQRLDRADADLLHSRRENLRLCDQVSSLEKEIALGDVNKETRPSPEMARIMADIEQKHTSTVTDLEGMINDQKQLMEKLTAECKSLTQKLEDTSLKHKKEMSALQLNVEFLNSKVINNKENLTNNPINKQNAQEINNQKNDNASSKTEELVVNQAAPATPQPSITNQRVAPNPDPTNEEREQQQQLQQPDYTDPEPTAETDGNNGYLGENPTISDKEYQQQFISKQGSKEQDESEYGGGNVPVSTPTPGNEQYEQPGQVQQPEYDNGQYDQQQYDNTANAEQYDQQQYNDQQYQDQQNFGATDYQQQPAYDDQQQYAGEYDQTAYVDEQQQQQQQPYPGEYEPVQSEENLGYATGAGGENEYPQQPE